MRIESYRFQDRPAELLWFPTAPSTNDLAKELAEQGRAEGTGVIADQQTAGRGRQGRTWHSPPGAGLYFSLILRPSLAPRALQLLTLMSAVAVAETVQHYTLARPAELPLDIKWPNDILLNGRKVSGILVESAFEGEQIKYAILGIGCNLNQTDFPPEVSERATSLKLETGHECPRSEFVARLLERLGHWYGQLEAGQHQAVIDRWLALSSYAQNKAVIVDVGTEKICGITCGLTDTGELRLQTPYGDFLTINAGEIITLR